MDINIKKTVIFAAAFLTGLSATAGDSQLAEPEGSISNQTIILVFLTLFAALAAVCAACARRLKKSLLVQKKLERIFDDLPCEFAVVSGDGEIVYQRFKTPLFAKSKRLREFGPKEEKLYKRAFREISDTALQCADFEFDASNSAGQHFETRVKPLPEELFGIGTYLISCENTTERHERQKRADTLLEHEKIYRIALQMIAQDKGFDNFTGLLLENITKWLGADRAAVYSFNSGTGSASILAECCGNSTKFPVAKHEINKTSKFYENILSQNILIYDCSDEKTEPEFDAVLTALKESEVKSAIIFGMLFDGETPGFLCVECLKNRRKFSELDKNTVLNVSKIIQIAQDRKVSYEKLRENYLQKSMILKSLDFPILLFDGDGNIKSANDAAAKIIGEKPCNISDYRDFNPICGTPPSDSDCMLKTAIETKNETVKRMVINGKLREISYKPLLNQNGEVAYIVVMFPETEAPATE